MPEEQLNQQSGALAKEESVVQPAAGGQDIARKKQWFWSIVVVVALLDQLTKWLVRTSPQLHFKVLIEDWLVFNLTSNPGMAMGISWAPTWVISIIAIIASAGIIWYAFSLIRPAPLGFMMAMGLIIGGAFGNILDRIYMGYVEGYGGILSGHVVDFIYFSYVWPEWLPWLGGRVAFPYIFNVADIAISVAVLTLILGAKWLLPHDQPKPAPKQDTAKTAAADLVDHEAAPDSSAEDARAGKKAEDKKVIAGTKEKPGQVPDDDQKPSRETTRPKAE